MGFRRVQTGSWIEMFWGKGFSFAKLEGVTGKFGELAPLMDHLILTTVT
jgi:hypothetical protein